MSLTLSSANYNLLSPLLKSDETGVALLAATYKKPDGVKSIRVISICQGSAEEFENVKPTLLHALTITFTKEPEHYPISLSAVGNMIVFKDDIKTIGKLNQAFVDIDLFEQAKIIPEQGTYYISAFFGQHLSDVVKIEL